MIVEAKNLAVGVVVEAMVYQMMQGVEPNGCYVIINVKNISSDEICNTIIYPDAME